MIICPTLSNRQIKMFKLNQRGTLPASAPDPRQKVDRSKRKQQPFVEQDKPLQGVDEALLAIKWSFTANKLHYKVEVKSSI